MHSCVDGGESSRRANTTRNKGEKKQYVVSFAVSKSVSSKLTYFV